MTPEQRRSPSPYVLKGARDTRYERVLYYLKRQFTPQIPHSPQSGPYNALLGLNTYEVLDHLFATPMHDDKAIVANNVTKRISQNTVQMEKWQKRWIESIAEEQLVHMAQAVSENVLPIRYAWSEKEVLHEILLATGKNTATLDEITAARFDATAAKEKYNGYSPMNGEYRLLRELHNGVSSDAPRFFTVHIEPDPERNNALLYRLDYLPEIHTFKDALDKYQHIVSYFNGPDSPEAIEWYTHFTTSKAA